VDTEFEAKFYPVDKDLYRQKLKSLGAKLIHPERKFRRALIDSRDYPQLKCTYVRVRDEGDCIRLSAKIHARAGGAVSDQKELDLTVSSYDKMVEMLQVMGFQIGNYQENLRETWEYKNAEIVIDTWPGLEPYIEIEAASENAVKDIALELGFNWTKKIITGVGKIYMDRYRLDSKITDEKLKHITFENNPFSGLPAFPLPNSQM
jgi:adenylate cyclase class 2